MHIPPYSINEEAFSTPSPHTASSPAPDGSLLPPLPVQAPSGSSSFAATAPSNPMPNSARLQSQTNHRPYFQANHASTLPIPARYDCSTYGAIGFKSHARTSTKPTCWSEASPHGPRHAHSHSCPWYPSHPKPRDRRRDPRLSAFDSHEETLAAAYVAARCDCSVRRREEANGASVCRESFRGGSGRNRCHRRSGARCLRLPWCS